MDEIVEFQLAGQWDKWLEKNYSKSKGMWIRFFKKASDVSSINNSDGAGRGVVLRMDHRSK